jgi:carbonic anhydrase
MSTQSAFPPLYTNLPASCIFCQFYRRQGARTIRLIENHPQGAEQMLDIREATEAAAEKFRARVHRFRTEVFPSKRERYEQLAEMQVPQVMFLTCGDSRIDPAALTCTEPGEIFVERTPGNIVPIYSDTTAVGVSASIEYSVAVLGVKAIIVCGHSACGAMKGLLDPEELHHIPATARWLKYAVPALDLLNRQFPQLDGPDRVKRLSQLNVLEQMEHLHSHPSVEARLKEGKLTLHGWYYEIHTGAVEVFNPQTCEFEEWL